MDGRVEALSALLRQNSGDAECMKAAKRGAEAGRAGDGAHLNPYRRAAVAGGPHDSLVRDCWEAGRVLYATTLLEQLVMPHVHAEAAKKVAPKPEPTSFSKSVMEEIVRLAGFGVHFTSDDVRRSLADPKHQNEVGMAMMRAARLGLVREVGMRRSERPAARGRRIIVYVGTGGGE